MFCITTETAKAKQPYVLPLEIKSYGPTYLLIKDPEEFLRRLKKYFKKNKIGSQCGKVQYYDDGIDQQALTLFHKRMKHKSENEYRIIAYKETTDKALKFRIGSLEDISEICFTNQYTGFQFVWE